MYSVSACVACHVSPLQQKLFPLCKATKEKLHKLCECQRSFHKCSAESFRPRIPVCTCATWEGVSVCAAACARPCYGEVCQRWRMWRRPMRTSSPLDDPDAGMPSMNSQMPPERRAPLTCHRVWHNSVSTSQVSNIRKNGNMVALLFSTWILWISQQYSGSRCNFNTWVHLECFYVD